MRSEKMADIMAVVLLLLMIFCLVAVPVLGLGIGLGYALKAMIPGLDLGWALVAGAVFAVGIVDMSARFLWATHEMKRSNEEDVTTDKPWVVFPRSFFPPAVSPRRGRKKR